tara:strand:- start:424 stop:831 length:408 start_codon:yes stop_codon:yes gene_type:complete
MSNFYVNQAAISIKKDVTPLIRTFFSDDNMIYLQKLLKLNIKQRINQVITEQSDHELYVIMLHVYVNFGKHCQQKQDDVSYLNELTLSILIPMVISNVQQHIGYLSDICSLPVPIARGEATTIKGSNPLEFNGYF